MGLLDLFTGAASQRAARNNVSAINSGLTLSADALTKGANSGMSTLGIPQAGGNALSALGEGYGQARDDIGNQYQQTQDLLGQQEGLYGHMASGGQGAYDRYLNSVGANGAAGSAQAAADFTAAPGTQYAMDQALDAVQRTAAARGGLAGGNTTADILRTATGLADQNYQRYVSNLGNAANSYGTALAGQSQSLTGQASASQTYGTQLGALGMGQGQNMASEYNLGAGIQTALGSGVSNLQTNAANALVGNNNNLAQSENAAGANILNGALGVAGLFASPAGAAVGRAGGGSAGGNIISSISSLFR